MLFMLTGEVQTGKTRWLERLTSQASHEEVTCSGVLAPGVWRRRAAGGAGRGEFEKLGIENVLLPGGERIPFARRRDLSQKEGTFDPSSQSAAAQLAWDISDAALARVNDHFASLSGRARDASIQRGLLIVDELGRLELMRGGGLTEAVSLLEAGPLPAFPHAVIVVRAALAELARERFATPWGGCQTVFPDDAGSAAIRSACEA